MPIKVKLNRVSGEYAITGLSRIQLAMLYHPHNIEGFSTRLPAEMAKASEEIFNALENAYEGGDFHTAVYDAFHKSTK